MLVSKFVEIDMGHRVPNHKSKCRHLHGHRYKIELGVDDKIIKTNGASNEGMVIDYGDLKQTLQWIIVDKFDHQFIMYFDDQLLGYYLDYAHQIALGIVVVNFIPTAENLAKHWYELLKKNLQEQNIKIKYVKVWETPTSTATYEE